MPTFSNDLVVSLARNLKAFLSVKAGVTRSGRTPGELSDVEAGNFAWIFGFGRSGSTWLRSMMAEIGDHPVWEEPLVGLLFGHFYYASIGSHESQQERPDFILGPEEETRRRLVRSFIMERAKIQFPRVGREDMVLVKEPNGSVGAPLIMEALPESRMILLVRDPRDVLASFIDSQRKEGWGRKLLDDERPVPELNANTWSVNYRRHMGNALETYKSHEGRKVLIRYEDLLSDTERTMKRVYSSLEIPADEAKLSRVVEKHAWKNIPDEEKGAGKFYRKGTAGGWRDDLTDEQVAAIEKEAGFIIEEFYYDRAE